MLAALPLGASWWVGGCGSDSSNEGGAGGGTFDAGAGGGRFDAGATPSDTGNTAADAGQPLPPEIEEVRSFEAPQAGVRAVYVANPSRDSVAVIDSQSLTIQTVEAGDGPTYLATLPGRDVALTINVNANTMTILRTEGGVTRTRQLPVVRNANAIAVAPDGRHAVVWLDTSRPNRGVPAGSFQDVTLVTFGDTPEADRAVQLSVGFRPLEVIFSRNSAAGFVVTEDGVSLLRFEAITGPTIVPSVSLGLNEFVPAADAGVVDAAVPSLERDARPSDVSVTPDGRYAVARVEGSRYLRLIDLESRQVRILDAGATVTDLDLTADGRSALAVLREQSTVLRVAVPSGFDTPAQVERVALTGELVGSVTASPDGRLAVLYTTAAPVERAVLLDLAGRSPPAVIRLRKTVRSVTFSPDSRTVMVVHNRTDGAPGAPETDLEAQIDRAWGYTLIDTATRFAKLQLTPATVGPFALNADGSYAFVLLRDDSARVATVQRVTLANFAVQDIVLGSPPTSVGTIAGTMRAFVGQLHPEGRITFIDQATGALQSVTGFELNSRIVN